MRRPAIPYPQRLPLARLPTPLQPLNRFIRGGSIQLFIKRDDQTGMLSSGNKVRKLEFLLREALDQGCDTLITCGALQSNHARTTAAVAARLGLDCLLILRGNPPENLTGNLLLNRLLGADIFYVSLEEYENIETVFEHTVKRLRKLGKKPYVIPEGGSNALGAFGYVLAMDEMVHQFRAQNLKMDTIVCAVGSGGTYAGLLLGKKLMDVPCEIVGINISETAGYFRERIFRIIQDAITRFGLDVQVRREEIRLLDGYVGQGYGRCQEKELDLIRRLAREEGILLDPVYTGKAMLGLLDQLDRNPEQFGRQVLFLHTGGAFSLFGYERELGRVP